MVTHTISNVSFFSKSLGDPWYRGWNDDDDDGDDDSVLFFVEDISVVNQYTMDEDGICVEILKVSY